MLVLARDTNSISHQRNEPSGKKAQQAYRNGCEKHKSAPTGGAKSGAKMNEEALAEAVFITMP